MVMCVVYVCMYVRNMDTDKDTRVGEKKYSLSLTILSSLLLHFFISRYLINKF